MTTEEEALAMVNAVSEERVFFGIQLDPADISHEALCRAIEQRKAIQKEHDDYKQKVSGISRKGAQLIEELAKSLIAGQRRRDEVQDASKNLRSLIIPAPKPDPLAQAVSEANAAGGEMTGQWIADFRAALDTLGFEIKEKADG